MYLLKWNKPRLAFSAIWNIDKVLLDKVFYVAKKMFDRYQRDVTFVVYKVYDKKPAAVNANISCVTSKSNIFSNQQLVEELNQPVTRKPGKHRLNSCFKNSVCGADLEDMQLISKYNKIICLLLWAIVSFCKTTIDLQQIFDETYPKQSKAWVDESTEFCNTSMKLSWLQDNGIEIYSG